VGRWQVLSDERASSILRTSLFSNCCFPLFDFMHLLPSNRRVDPSGYLPLVYRPEIDGLRAIAVLAVVFFHAGLACPGGFVGVDVFFVISGYLITALLLREFEEGRFSMVDFWERRVRRIFPAGAAMVLVTLLAGVFLLSPTDFEKLGWSALSQSVMGANLFFWRQPSGYFADNGMQPLLHTWSLAVEEQFYLIFPLLLLFFHRKVAVRTVLLRRLLWICIGTSLVMAVTLLPKYNRAVFYLLPTRAWELLGGSLLAAFPAAWLISQRWLKETLSWVGMAGILLPICMYSKSTMFPGLAAVPPCLGAGAIIWANLRTDDAPLRVPTFIGRLFTLRPVVFIGLISYSLYLWHWPVLSYMNYSWQKIEGSSIAVRLLMVFVGLCLAVASWRWIEVPFRKKRLAGNRSSIFCLGATVTTLLLILSGSVVMFVGFPSRVSERFRLNDLAQADTGFREEVTIADVVAGRIPRFGSNSQGTPATMLLWGDSHAMHAIAALDSIYRSRGSTFEVVTYSATAPLIDYISHDAYGLNEKGPEWANATVEHIQSTGIKEIILAARWEGYEIDGTQRLETALRKTILRLNSMGCRVWILQDVPTFGISVPLALKGESPGWVWRYSQEFRPTEHEHRQRNSVLYRLAGEGLAAVFVDPSPALLDPETGRYRADADGISLFHDSHHLTTRGSRLVLLPVLRDSLGQPIAATPASHPTFPKKAQEQ
jgi:peptidoglycan/LPS O-acetylase OafA/YrhL